MHLYIITRGIKHEVDKFITQLQGKYLPFEVKKGAAGLKKGKYMIQTSVRPIQLWEIAYPKEHNDLMCASLLNKDKGKPLQKWQEKFVWGIRKALKLKKIPKYKTDEIFPISRDHMEIVGLGVKEDYSFEDGTEAI